MSCCHWLINSDPDDLVPLCKYLKFTGYENKLISKEMDNVMMARCCLLFTILTASFVRCKTKLLMMVFNETVLWQMALFAFCKK